MVYVEARSCQLYPVSTMMSADGICTWDKDITTNNKDQLGNEEISCIDG